MRNAYDLAKEFVEQQSEGEWGDDLVRKDASRLSDLICADREAMRKECAAIADRWTTPEQRQYGGGGPAAEIQRVGLKP